MTVTDIETVESGGALHSQVRHADRSYRRSMLLLMAPSVFFVALLFVFPLALFLFKSVDNRELPEMLPQTTAIIETWTTGDLPPDSVYAAIVADIQALDGGREAALLGRRLNYAEPGFRSLITKTARALPDGAVSAPRETLAEISTEWESPEYWAVLRQQSGALTDFYLLSALDLKRDNAGEIERVDEKTAVFLSLYVRTLETSIAVTVLCLLIGFPVAALMTSVGPAAASWLLTLVLVPFWTSLLVRSTAWIVLLQNEGLVNKTLIWLGVINTPLPMIYNTVGVYIAMTHVLLPYMILPLYSIMQSISPSHLRAASSLGATPLRVFMTVYLPLTFPGIAAGCTLVFVIALGFYVTPALVGGPGDQMIGYFIAYFTNSAVNWGLASALGVLLMLVIVVIYLVLGKLVGLDRLKVR